jgi:ankyrin repeat protein
MDDALKEAISFGDLEACDELLAAGTAAHVVDDEVGSPLHLAASINEGKIVGLLLRHGAKVNYVNPGDGSTALHTAYDYFVLQIFPRPVVFLLAKRGLKYRKFIDSHLVLLEDALMR